MLAFDIMRLPSRLTVKSPFRARKLHCGRRPEYEKESGQVKVARLINYIVFPWDLVIGAQFMTGTQHTRTRPPTKRPIKASPRWQTSATYSWFLLMKIETQNDAINSAMQPRDSSLFRRVVACRRAAYVRKHFVVVVEHDK